MRIYPYCLCAILALSTRLTNAQTIIGLKAGPDFCKLLNAVEALNASYNQTQFNSQTSTRFYGGVSLDFPLAKSDHLYLRAQPSYVGAGGELPLVVDFSGNVLLNHTNYYLNYMDLPLQFIYRCSVPFGKPWIGVGPYGGMLVSAKTKAGGAEQSLSIGSGPSDAVQRFDFGYAATAGFAFKCGFFLGADFQHGLVSISPSKGIYASNPRLNTRNVVWGVHLGYEWTLKD